MKLLIKILGQTKQYPALHVDYGTGYTFPWNEALKAYAYAPKSQKEIDDIFQSQSIHAVWFFAPVLIDDAKPAAPAAASAAPAPAPAPEKPTPEAEAEIARLNGLLKSATGTIAMLRADLKAAQERTAKAAAPEPKKAGRKGGAKADATPTDSPAPDLAPE